MSGHDSLEPPRRRDHSRSMFRERDDRRRGWLLRGELQHPSAIVAQYRPRKHWMGDITGDIMVLWWQP